MTGQDSIARGWALAPGDGRRIREQGFWAKHSPIIAVAVMVSNFRDPEAIQFLEDAEPEWDFAGVEGPC